ncbi:MAG: caspase family protein, partial [Pseudomonadota bacterium]
MILTRCIIGLAILLASTAHTYAGAGRVALVIGNSAYKHAAVLDNPVNDANDIAAALQKQSFKVIKGIDLDHAGMLATIRKFSRALSKGDVGVFF